VRKRDTRSMRIPSVYLEISGSNFPGREAGGLAGDGRERVASMTPRDTRITEIYMGCHDETNGRENGGKDVQFEDGSNVSS
jgi:hypothetical protein